MIPGNPSTSTTVPAALPDSPQLSSRFVVNQARQERINTQEAKGKKRAERRARGIASRNTTVQHFEPYSRGVQFFIKFFLGGPKNPQDYPDPPSEEEKRAQYWIEKRSQQILKQLETLRQTLSSKPVAEQDYFVARAESEIRKRIKLPPFIQAKKVGELRASHPISLQVKADVERELALGGICRMTFEWSIQGQEESTWNYAVVDIMARKSVEWLRLWMKLTDEQAAEAPAIVKRWLQGKCREITQFKNSDAGAYKAAKQSTLVKQQFTRWRKKVRGFFLDVN